MSMSESYMTAIEDIKKAWEFISIKNGVENKAEPDCLRYVHLEPQIQLGPTCGLIALSMISSLTAKPKSVAELLNLSLVKGYTKKGEMFCAKRLCHIARLFLEDSFSITHHTGGLQIRYNEIVDDLLNNSILLVPYDSDKDHSPGQFNGHKAHWAVVCGIIVDVDYLIARQGKSKHVGVWSFEDLSKSNLNLVEISPERSKEENAYIFHDMKETLRGHYITFKIL